MYLAKQRILYLFLSLTSWMEVFRIFPECKLIHISIQETPEQVLWQTEKIQMKCNISSRSSLFAKIKMTIGTEIHHNLEYSICDQLKFKVGNPILIVSICIENPSEYKELRHPFTNLKLLIR